MPLQKRLGHPNGVFKIRLLSCAKKLPLLSITSSKYCAIRHLLLCQLDRPFVLQLEALDVYLPLLVDSFSQTCNSIAQLLASALRSQSYRIAVSEWLPQIERHKEVKGKRGWEKPDTVNSPSRQGGWVARQLVALLQRKDTKVGQRLLGWPRGTYIKVQLATRSCSLSPRFSRER